MKTLQHWIDPTWNKSGKYSVVMEMDMIRMTFHKFVGLYYTFVVGMTAVVVCLSDHARMIGE